jgi:alkyl sulfatase BDS1-like metallo-beta-lactamase superfamily hydrolase
VASQLVFADPTNQEARGLAADAYEQMGYQAESSTARNSFLQGAWELRNGVPKVPAISTQAPDVIRALNLDMFFDYLGVRLNGDKAAGKTSVLNWQFTDTKQNYVLNLENSALTYVADAQAANADATLTLTRATLDEISLQKTTFPAALQSGQIAVTGKREHVPVDRTAPGAVRTS